MRISKAIKWGVKTLAILVLIMATVACTNHRILRNRGGGTANLTQLRNLTAGTQQFTEAETHYFRAKGLRETALSLGAQAGLAWESRKINCMLNANNKSLDKAFNFRAIILPHNVLPPVLTEGDDAMHIQDCQTIRIADRMYKIEKQACFVAAVPTWRDYLMMPFKQPEIPDKSLLPNKVGELKIWKECVTIGWKRGINQAWNIFRDNVATLSRDFKGMIRYRYLLTQNMVSPPFVARTNLGVTGGGDELAVNDHVLRITALPQLNADSHSWKAAIGQ